MKAGGNFPILCLSHLYKILCEAAAAALKHYCDTKLQISTDTDCSSFSIATAQAVDV